jgi:hypothetical protein
MEYVSRPKSGKKAAGMDHQMTFGTCGILRLRIRRNWYGSHIHFVKAAPYPAQ